MHCWNLWLVVRRRAIDTFSPPAAGLMHVNGLSIVLSETILSPCRGPGILEDRAFADRCILGRCGVAEPRGLKRSMRRVLTRAPMTWRCVPRIPSGTTKTCHPGSPGTSVWGPPRDLQLLLRLSFATRTAPWACQASVFPALSTFVNKKHSASVASVARSAPGPPTVLPPHCPHFSAAGAAASSHHHREYHQFFLPFVPVVSHSEYFSPAIDISSSELPYSNKHRYPSNCVTALSPPVVRYPRVNATPRLSLGRYRSSLVTT